ncbi:GNAT family N-acetyltransferase [Alkalihalobacillus hemicellulosilyticus]|uniref:Acetyltransferase n=1 Tax=Halalkalibacter hemicellulosilyticusJCM 9152 TaxID=1236971 RepID=W4QFC0_9BACI|nr:GNAT family protein [Halalkalibacter hemicellulosilyticus]GAE30795.1 acetyltransferase [Halalkalibacter hemicellulosilyticusJCM 9152]
MIKQMEDQFVTTFTAKDGRFVRLRPATIQDAENIVTSVESIINEGTYLQKEQARTVDEEREFIQNMQQSHNMYAVVELDGVARGIARVIRGELKMKHHTGMFRTWLYEDAQGIGIGKHLMNYTLDWCRVHKLHKLCLTVFSTNDVAVKLYEKVGFVIEGIQREQALIHSQYVDEIWMAYFFHKDGVRT